MTECAITSPVRLLFILKQRSQYDFPDHNQYSASSESGLSNSVRFLVSMLRGLGVESKIAEVVDNNCIDREVHQYRPTHVFIEALWVVPEKFDILQKLHPTVQWVVRLHSNIPFIANEGIAIDWIKRYVKHENVAVAANSDLMARDIRIILRSAFPKWGREKLARKVQYLPNYYPVSPAWRTSCRDPRVLEVGCFGAIRPMKNNLIQAIAAIHYADKHHLKLRFHINAGRKEQGGDSALKNLRALFENTRHELVEHGWMSHHNFLHLLSTMDLSLCVSFTETFCIVAADSVSVGVPTVVSSEIPWASRFAVADTTDLADIEAAISRVLCPFRKDVIAWLNRRGLQRAGDEARELWRLYTTKPRD